MTNGTQWHLYRVILDQDGLDADLLFSLDLTKENQLNAQAHYLALLQHDAVKKDSLGAYWEKHDATTPQAIAKALFHEEVLQSLRKQLRKDQNAIVAAEELASCLQRMFSEKTRQETRKVKIKRKNPKKDSGAQMKGAVDVPCTKQKEQEAVVSGATAATNSSANSSAQTIADSFVAPQLHDGDNKTMNMIKTAE